MSQLLCETVSRGMRDEERTVSVRNAVTGERSFVRVEFDFLTRRGDHYYIPVGVVQEEPQHGLALVELPQAPDAGSTRLWARLDDLLRNLERRAGQYCADAGDEGLPVDL